MNRKKKLLERIKQKTKNPDNRIQNSKKEKYISKAERAKQLSVADTETQNEVSSTDASDK
jgi:hypothetical protein